MSPQISTPIHFENELKERKAQVIERIKDVRTAQRAFRAEYQRYAEDFDELERFLHANPTELRCDIEQLRYIPNSDNEFSKPVYGKNFCKNIFTLYSVQ